MAFHQRQIAPGKALILLLLALVPTATAFAQMYEPRTAADTLPAPDDSRYRLRGIDYLSTNRLYRATYFAVPLIAESLIMKGEDTHFRNMRNDFIPKFKHHQENFFQYLPLVVTAGMKACGVESRDSWERMAASAAMSSLIMAGTVGALKRATKVERPDKSNKRSFPSGHTATAFTMATILHREYGHIHPLISIGSYATAAGTGLMRVGNNRHWMSDVMAGAGFGILSAELGYYITDAIFKERGLLHPDNYREAVDRYARPSFVGLQINHNIPLSRFDLTDNMVFKTSGGSCVAVEGAYFFNTYLGIGGRVSASSLNIITNNSQAEPNRLNMLNSSVGAYASYPLTNRWLVGTKLVGGMVHYKRLELTSMSIPARNGVSAGSGLSFTFRAEKHLSLQFSANYDLLPPQSRTGGEYFHMLSIGATTAMTF